jgi:hypothetical protein
MFSGLAFLIGGNMAVAASVLGGALIRVDPAKSTRLITTTVAEPMLIDGRSMGPGWTDLDAEHVRTKRQLEKWIESPLHPSSSIILGDDRTSRRRGADQDRRGQRGRRRFHDAALRRPGCHLRGLSGAARPPWRAARRRPLRRALRDIRVEGSVRLRVVSSLPNHVPDQTG